MFWNNLFVVEQLIVDDLKAFCVELDELAEHVKAALYDLFRPGEVYCEDILHCILHYAAVNKEQLIGVRSAASQVALDGSYQPKPEIDWIIEYKNYCYEHLNSLTVSKHSNKLIF